MSIVGIICEPRYENQIKQILNKTLKNKTILVLKEENIENFKNITFETIVIFSKQNQMLTNNRLNKIIEQAKYLVINADEEIELEIENPLDLKVITYGFNTKSTVTASSVTEEEILICVQRNIVNLEQKQIEPQEILVKNDSLKLQASTMMGIVTILFIYCFPEINF